ncbi:MAG: hypothetical protein IH984_14770 [Planctomycetes bacterium]|nr:hypothetical protein [Planctomycetota bacterium]
MLSYLRLATLLSLALLAGCGRNPARPAKVAPDELKRPAYKNFFEVFGGGEQEFHGAMIYTRAGPNGPQMYDGKASVGVFHPIAGHNDMVLAILYDANPITDPPPMQLQLLGRFDEAGIMWGEPGDPMILCDLRQEQVDWAFGNGIPQPLIDEMVRVAIDAAWSSELPVRNQFGRFILVDADGYFPPTTDTEDKAIEDEAERSDQPPD